jgi:hypothetical protein
MECRLDFKTMHAPQSRLRKASCPRLALSLLHLPTRDEARIAANIASCKLLPRGENARMLVLKSWGKSVAIYKFTHDALQPLTETELSVENILERKDLHRILRNQIQVLDPDLMVVSEEFGFPHPV